jgi:uncharacterized protein involved in outer membrane biogenesis
MYRGLIIIGGLLVGLLAAAFAVPAAIDWNRYRGVFEEEASRLIGREVRVGGAVNLRLLPTPYVSIERVRIADAEATVGEPLFKADEFTIWLAVGPLFSGAIQASQIELRKPTLTLVLDDKGGGNWSSLGDARPKSTFTPNRVALDNMRITNGTVAVRNADGRERAVFERINGEVSAAALEGPYRINVAYATDTRIRELKLSTAAPEADGSFRFKGTVRAPELGASFTLDGIARDVMRHLRVDGEISAKIPIPLRSPARQAAAPAPASGTAMASDGVPAKDAAFDLKAKVQADTSKLALSDIALVLEDEGPPQLATGTATLDWRQQADLKVDLASHWFDFDRIGGGQDVNVTVPARLWRFARALDQILPVEGQTSGALTLDQATLGGEVLSNVAFAIDRSGGALSIRNLSAMAPGGSRLQASGALNPGNAENVFDGEFNLRGASFTRFLSWLGKGLDIPTPTQDGTFLVSGRALIGSERISGRNLTMQIAGNGLTGDLSWSGSGRRQLVAALEGSELDVTPLLEPGQPPMTALKALIARLGVQANGGPAAPAWPEVLLRLRVGRFLAAGHEMRDVVADLKYTGGNFVMPLLRLGAPIGWAAELRGDILNLTQPGARGNITGVVSADSAAALGDLTQLLDLPQAARPSLRRAGSLTPARLAGRLAIGEAAQGNVDIVLDGTLGVSRIGGTVRLGPEAPQWRDRRGDIAVTVEGGDAGALAAQLLPDAMLPAKTVATPVATPVPARLTVRGIGNAGSGFVTLAAFDAAGVKTEFRGRVSVDETAKAATDGTLRLQIEDLANVLAMTKVGARAPFIGTSASGQVKLILDGDRLQLQTDRLALAETNVGGKLEIAGLSSARRVSGDLTVPGLSVPRLLDLMTTRAAASDGAAKTAESWSEATFDLDALASFEGAVRIDSRSVTLAPGVAFGPAKAELALKGGKASITVTDAAARGGKLSGALRIERAPGGARVTGEASLKGARLETERADGTPNPDALLGGEFGIDTSFEGLGLNPRSVIAGLKGKGVIALKEARFAGVSPQPVRAAAAAVLALKNEVPAGELRRQLDDALPRSPLPLGQREVRFEIGGGAVRIDPIAVEVPEGTARGTTTIDLDALRFDSEWKIAAKPLPRANAAKPASLPAIAIVFTGPLARSSEAETRLSVDALDRELTVYRMEHEVEELERLRHQDEQRVRQEVERQRLERERLDFQRQTTVIPTAPSATTPTAAPDAAQQAAPPRPARRPPARVPPSPGIFSTP